MEYVKAFRARTGAAALDDGATRESVAAECRQAALAFLSGVASGWDKLDLALWLSGPYALATRHVPRGERVTGMDADTELDDAVAELLARTRGEVIASLRAAARSAGMLDFVERAIDHGLVRRGVDDEGYDVWVPVDSMRARLLDRVRSLFAADYLDDAAGYLELFVCQECEAVVFDEDAKRRGVCPSHRRASGVVPREGGTIPKVAGDD